MKEVHLGNVMIDCDDEQGLCEFYHRLLGWKKGVLFGRPAVTSENGIVFLFIQEETYVPPIWPEQANQQQKQLHFDFQVEDVEQMAAYAQSLGASKPDSQYGGCDFVTMLDPAGHPFCLCAQENTP